jgi:carbonic anhydrase
MNLKQKIIIAAFTGVITIAPIYTEALAKDNIKSTAAIVKTISSEDALRMLIAGNDRYASGKFAKKDLSDNRRQNLYKNGQKPFAIILSCSDSRVPPELIFDMGLGDIFVVRDAGNVVDAIETGSVEYGAKHLKAHLIVVMGHDKCGAVQAAVEGKKAAGSIGAIVQKIKPSVDKVRADGAKESEIVQKAENENIKNSVEELRKSPVIKELIGEKKLKIVAAKYHLNTGKVELFK